MRAGTLWHRVRGRARGSRSKDPECELARALLARGITGKITLIDANTGKARIVIDIEKCAKLTVQETRRHGPRFVRWRPNPFGAVR